MEEILEILLDAFIDSAKMLPLLLVVYFVIEFLEYKEITAFENSRLLKGRFSPLFGSLFGCVPQCGFSVISTDLYSAKKISVGALVAVYIATSDEALPILFSGMINDPKVGVSLVFLIAGKIVFAIAAGYLAMFLFPLVFKKNAVVAPQIKFGDRQIETVPTEESPGCCKHEIKTKKFNYLHPVMHMLKIFAYVLAVNVLMGLAVFFVGEENLTAFIGSAYWFQPLASVVVGLIPNCASSVLLTNLYLTGALGFGPLLAGLSVNAGLGVTVLLKKNRPMSENAFVIGFIVAISLIVGYAISAIAILI
jgi:hypothetical protein